MYINKSLWKTVFWTISIFSFMFQSYFPQLSKLIIPCLVLFIIGEFQNIKLKKVRGWEQLYLLYLVFLCISMAVSLFTDADFSNVLRFLLILMAIPISSLIYDNEFKTNWKIFKILSFVEAIIIICIWGYVFVTQKYMDLRVWARGAGVGDVYIVRGIPKVQLLGTTMFVMGFALDFFREKKLTMYNLAMLAGGIAAGSTAYILGFVYVGMYAIIQQMIILLKKQNWKILILSIAAIAGVILCFYYFSGQWEQKALYSNIIRKEQMNLLLDTNPFIGRGLGHKINATTTFREYNGQTYFELQTLYIYHQVGAVSLLLFYILTISPFVKKDKTQLICYFIYLAYTFWNPYCFDSTHILTILLISNILEEKKSVQMKEQLIARKQNQMMGSSFYERNNGNSNYILSKTRAR